MSKNFDLSGISDSTELGKGGPRIKGASGALEARDNSDASFSVVRGAEAVGSSDFVTKSQLDSVSADHVRVINTTFAYDTVSPFNIGDALPAGAIVIRVSVLVSTVFDGTPLLEIGDSVDTDRLMGSSDINLEVVGVYTKNLLGNYASSTQIIGTASATSPTQGGGAIVIEYID